MKVGFIDITVKENEFKLRGEIEYLLRSVWLDYKTSLEFEDKARKAKDPLYLKKLKEEITAEITSRKRKYSN